MEPNLTKLNEKFSPKLRARVWQPLPYSGFKHLLQCCHHSQLLWEPELNGYRSHSQHIKIVVQVLSFQKQQIRLLLTTKPIVFEGKWWKCSSSSVNLLHLMEKKSHPLSLPGNILVLKPQNSTPPCSSAWDVMTLCLFCRAESLQ